MQDLIDWLSQSLTNIYNSLVSYFSDLAILILDGILSAIATVIEGIPVPSFIQGGMNTYIGGLDSSILYFLSRSGLVEAFAILGAGLAFRLSRKVFTLGQW